MKLNISPDPRLTKYLAGRNYFSGANQEFVIVDVGARHGAKLHWQSLGKEAKIIGFEPDVKEAQFLNDKFANENHRYYPIALHRNKDTHTFFLTNRPGWSGFYRPDPDFVERYDLSEFLEVVGETQLETTSLDLFCNEENIGPVDFIKIDAEGGELDILRGANEVLRDTLGLELEYAFAPRTGRPVFHQMDEYLLSHNFRIFDICVRKRRNKVLATKTISYKHGRAIGGDVLYLRDAVSELKAEVAPFWTKERIMKLVVIYDLYGLQDCAIELLLLAKTRGLIDKGLDVARMIDLLTPLHRGKHQSYKQFISRGALECEQEDTESPIELIWRGTRLFLERYLPKSITRLIRSLVAWLRKKITEKMFP